MIRSDLVLRVAAQNPHLHDKDCEAIVSAILDRIADALVAGERVELRDFGAYTVTTRRARTGRNPKTGEPVLVDEKASIRFKPGKGICARMNAKSVHEKPASKEPASRLPRAF